MVTLILVSILFVILLLALILNFKKIIRWLKKL